MSSETSTTSKAAKAPAAPVPVTPLPPTLKLSAAASSQKGNVNASLAKLGIFTASGPAGGAITALFTSNRTSDTYPEFTAGSKASLPVKLLAADLSALGDGPVTAWVYYTSASGAESDFATISFVLDTVAPNTPSLSLSKPSGPTGLSSALTGAVSVRGEAGGLYTSTFKANGQSLTLTTRASGNADPLALTQAQLNILGQGTVTVSTTETDLAGNVSSAGATSFVLDTLAPSAPTVALFTGITSATKVTQQQATVGAITTKGDKGDTFTTTFTNSSGVSVKVSTASDGTLKPVPLTNDQVQTLGGGLIKTVTVETDPAGNTSLSSSINFTLQAPTTPVTPPVPPVSKTVARIDFYDTATNLYDGMQFNFRMMEGALNTSKDKVEIYALWDQSTSGSYATGGGSQKKWTTVGTALLQPNPSAADPVLRPGVDRNNQVEQTTIYTKFELGPELDTGDINNLKNFVGKAATTGTSSTSNISSRTLILSDHGGGILAGFNFDDSGNDAAPATGKSMSGVQLANLLSQANGVPKYDIVGFDECMMGSVELAYGLRNVTKYMLASEETVGGNGFDYFKTLANTNTALGAVDLGKRFVDSFRDGYGSTPQIGVSDTLSLTDLSKMTDVAANIRTFVDNMVQGQSAQFWSAVSSALQKGTYYTFSYYQDLAGFVGRVAQIGSATKELTAAAGNLLNSLGGAILANTIQSGGVNLTPSKGMNPVEQGSYGLSVVLPYNAASYSELTSGSGGMQAFVDSAYRNAAGDFLKATNWDQLLVALEKNNCYSTGRSRLNKSESIPTVQAPLPLYTDSSKLDFYLGFSDYVDNASGDPLEGQVCHPLGFLNGNSTDSTAKVKLGDVSFELELADTSLANLTVDLWDTAKNQSLATLSTTASDNVVFKPALIQKSLKTTLVSPTMELRVKTDDADGVPFSTIVHLNGNKMKISPKGFTSKDPLQLSSVDTTVSAQILDKSHPDRWYSFTTDRISSPLAIETLSVSTEDFKLEVIKNPGTAAATTVTRTGSGIMGEYYIPEPNTNYAVHVSNPRGGKAVDFELLVQPQYDPSEWIAFSPDVLALSQKFEAQGKITVTQPGTNEAKLIANLFSDEASLGATFSGIGNGAPIQFAQIKSNHDENSLTRASVAGLTDESDADELLDILTQSAGASIGAGAAAAVDLSGMGAAFSLQYKPSKTASTVYKSTDPDTIPGIYEDDVYVGFGNGAQISIDSGVYKLSIANGEQPISFTVANGNPCIGETGGQTDSLFFYQVDSVSGDLNEGGKWIHPGDAGYVAAALTRASTKEWGTEVQPSSGVEADLDLEGAHIAMGIVANGGLSDLLDKNPTNSTTLAIYDSTPHAFFSVAGANPDKASHMISLGNSTYAFEDVLNGWRNNKNDFAGLMVRFDGASLV